MNQSIKQDSDSLGKSTKKVAKYQQKLTNAQTSENTYEELYACQQLGKVYLENHQYDQATKNFSPALELAKTVKDPQQEAIALVGLGKVAKQQNNISEAIDYYKKAINIAESIRATIKHDNEAVSFTNLWSSYYEELINLLFQTSKFEEAFCYVERAKARSLLDQLANGTVKFNKRIDPELLEQQQTILGHIHNLNQQLIELHKPPKNKWKQDQINKVDKELTDCQKKYEELFNKIQDRETACLIRVDVAKLPQIQELLDEDTTLVEYFVTKERTLAFVITRDQFKPYSLADGSRENLSNKILDFPYLSDRNNNPNLSPLEDLYNWLIEPLKSDLKTSTLGIVPHSILHYLPFAALKNGDRYLCEDYALFNLPSSSILRFLPEKCSSSTKTLLLLGNPKTSELLSPLQWAGQEVQAIATLFGSPFFVEKDATESRFWSDGPNSEIIHIAAHGNYNSQAPLFSALYLAPSAPLDMQKMGQLEVHDIYQLDLRKFTNLVVLSACQTNSGKLDQGDEILGLNRAFLYAGTPAIIASLWNVDDAATKELMISFYTHLKNGMCPSKALQEAQKEMRKNDGYQHPYYWAAFVLTGDCGAIQ